jgi:AcrR family transcriptional regulator
MKIKKKTAKKLAPKNSPNGSRGEKTRRMILDAATKVFAMHPYNAASIRMIAAQGEFYHGLIRYHFPNKAKIFETVVEEACQNLRQ